MRSTVGALLVALMFLTQACGSKAAQRPTAAKPARSLPRFLQSIPEDTPYVIAALEAAPASYYAKAFDALGPTFVAELEKQSAKDPESMALIAAIRRELAGKWNAAGMASIGVSVAPRFALYGAGPVVVARVELGDSARLLDTIRRIATAWGKPLPPAVTTAGITYWRIDEPKSSFVVALGHDELVFAAGNAAAVGAQLDIIIGTRNPPHNLGDGTVLERAMERHRLGPYLVGIVETRRVIDLLVTGEFAACTAQLQAMSALVPRVVMGHTLVGAHEFSGGIVVELAPELVRELRGLRTGVPGLSSLLAADSYFTFGGGIDLTGARALTRRAAASVQTLAGACDAAPLRELAESLDRGVAKWVPAPFDSVTGFALAVHDLAPPPPGSKVPERLQAIGVLASTDARALFQAVIAAMPGFGAFGVEPDGAIREVAHGFLPFPVFAGVGDRAIVLATGDKDGRLAETVIGEKPERDAPFLAMSYDYARWAQIERMLNIESRDAALQAAMSAMFGRSTVSVDIAEDGLVLWSTIEIK